MGGLLCVSLAGVMAIRRYLDIKNLKEELRAIPWDTERVTWKHYFKTY